MTSQDNGTRLSTACAKSISFSEKDCVKMTNSSPPADTEDIKCDEADEDSLLMGQDVNIIKSLECCQTSISNSGQLTSDEKTAPKRRSSGRLSLQFVGSIVSRFVRRVSIMSSDSPETRRRRKYDSPECLELMPIIERVLTNKLNLPDSFVPGSVGLHNHGNTCYMNAVLQCLSNTEQLTAFFLSDRYKTALKQSRCRFSNISSFGTATFTHSTTTLNATSDPQQQQLQERGKKPHSNRSRGLVTEHLASLIKSLWMGCYSHDVSSRFRTLVGRMGKQFKGSTQQDAHEFLLWLLDQLHEDLRVGGSLSGKKKPSKSKSCLVSNTSLDDNSATIGSCSPLPTVTGGSSDRSAINDLFQAHYRSSLACLKCGHRSHTFDPFLVISLSVMTSSSFFLGIRHPIFVVVVYLSATPKQVRIGLQMKHGCTIKDLRNTISNDTKIPKEQLVLADMRLDGHVATLFDDQPIENFRSMSTIYAIEIPKPDLVENHVVMVVINKFENGVQYERFGEPVVLYMHKSSSFFDMQQDLFCEMKPHVVDSLDAYSFSKTFLDLRLVNFGNRSDCYYMSSESYPLCSLPVTRALARCVSGPPHIMVIAEWYQMTRNNFSPNMSDSCVEHESVNVVRSAQHATSCSLEDCFQVYTQKEQLGADNAWYCPSCNKKQVETLKTLTLWSLPKILIVHLKRFKHDSSQRSKLDTLVTFPTRDLDLSDHLAKGAKASTASNPASTTGAAIPATFGGQTSTTNRQTSVPGGDRCTLTIKSSSSSSSVGGLSSNASICHSVGGGGEGRRTAALQKSKSPEASTKSTLDCPPVIMKMLPVAATTQGSVSRVAALRSSSSGSTQNEVKPKTNCLSDSPSAINLSANRVAGTTSETSLVEPCQKYNAELYDLYAVCNHYGSLHDGHYTAYCKNPITRSWFTFNDTHVTPIREEDVVTKHAYLLFYRKKASVHSSHHTGRPSFSSEGVVVDTVGREGSDKSPVTASPVNVEGNNLNECIEEKQALKQVEPPKEVPSSAIGASANHQGSPLPQTRLSSFTRFKLSFKRHGTNRQTATIVKPKLLTSLSTESHEMQEKESEQNSVNTKQPNSPSSENATNYQQANQIKMPCSRNGQDRKKGKSLCSLVDCRKFCMFSSSESVVCSDVQLSQLHSLQESRV